jgi:hypothetical protein
VSKLADKGTNLKTGIVLATNKAVNLIHCLKADG